MAFGVWLLDAIEGAEMDQAEFARRVGVRGASVSRWVNDQAQPSAKNALDIARVLRLPPAEILYRISGRDTDWPLTVVNLPPNLTRGEAELVEHLAWAVRHWREDENARAVREHDRLETPDRVA